MALKDGDYYATEFPGTAAGLQAAIDYLGSVTGGRIYVGPGTIAFGTSTISIPYGKVKLTGSGNRTTKFTYSGTGDFITIGVDDGDHAGTTEGYDGTGSQTVLSDLWIYGPGTATTARAIVDWESGSNTFERLDIQQFGTGYYAIGADVSYFNSVLFSQCTTGTHLLSRSDQNQFDQCYWAQNTIGMIVEYAYNTRIMGGQFVFSTTADLVVDCPSSGTEGGDVRLEIGLACFGTWFESLGGSPPTQHHIWLGRNGDSSHMAEGMSLIGCYFLSSNDPHIFQIDAATGIRVYGCHQAGTSTTAYFLVNSVASVFPAISVASCSFSNASTIPMYSGAGYGLTMEHLSQTRTIQAISAAATTDPNGATSGEIVQPGALAQNVTVSAPTNATKGKILTFRFLQDGTGGWTVGWNAVFKHAWSDTGNTANKRSTISFYYDGSNWNQIGAQSPYI